MSDYAVPIPEDLFEAIARRAAELVSPPEASPYLTTEQAALFLACKPKRIYKLREAGRITPYREGGRLLFLRADVERLVEAGEP